jgi:CRP/FNR family transcriptional regulator, nitrogen fixation regulation protein
MGQMVSPHPSGKAESQVAIGERASWSEFKYLKGTEVFAEAETAEYVYQILSGAVRTFAVLPDGRRQIGAFYLPGDVFGIENGDVHRLTAEAIVDTKVLVAKRNTVLGESEESLTLSRELLKLVTKSLHHAESRLMVLGRQTAIERVAAFLIEMDRRLQSPATIVLPMKRRDIADYLGLTVESVSRALSIFEREGLLSFQGHLNRQFVLHRRARLTQLATSSEGITSDA